MQEVNLFKIFTSRFNKMSIRYMVTGAVASIIYGEPRLTNDIDLIIELKSEQAEEIAKVFPQEDFYCPPIEVIRVEINRPLHGHFNIIHQETGFRADVYLMGEDILHQWAMAKRKKIEIEGEPFWLAPPEYVVLRKLQYYRESEWEKHLRDIANILEVSSDEIDFKFLKEEIEKYGLQKEWSEVKKLTTKETE